MVCSVFQVKSVWLIWSVLFGFWGSYRFRWDKLSKLRNNNWETCRFSRGKRKKIVVDKNNSVSVFEEEITPHLFLIYRNLVPLLRHGKYNFLKKRIVSENRRMLTPPFPEWKELSPFIVAKLKKMFHFLKSERHVLSMNKETELIILFGL